MKMAYLLPLYREDLRKRNLLVRGKCVLPCSNVPRLYTLKLKRNMMVKLQPTLGMLLHPAFQLHSEN